MTKPVERVAVIGLGAMGLPMASRLAESFTVSGFDPFEERRVAAAAAGVTPAVTPAEAASGVDLALVAVRDAAQAETALFGDDGAARSLPVGAIVLLTSTIGPDAARELETKLVAAGFRVVDAPVSGGPVRAGIGDLLIVAGGDAEALADAGPVLDALASALTIVGDKVGDGQMLKVINQLLAGVHIAAAAEAIALARGVGLDPDVVISALKEGAGGSFMLADRGPRMVETYTSTPQVKSRVDIFVKDMGIVADIAEKANVPTRLASAARELYREAERAGLGAADDSSVVTILSPKN
jgi:3-hydroxyisobutyrate dehydrogenase